MPNRLAGSAVKLSATALALIVGTAGLAVAGVDLPEPAQQAFERVGVSLPNQAGGNNQAGEHSRSDEVKSVIELFPPGDRGCVFGHRVAEAAKGSSLPEKAREACEHGHGDGTDNGKDNGRSTRFGEGSTSAGSDFGQETAVRAQGQRHATVEQRRQFGPDTAERAKRLGSDHPTGPPANVPSPPDRPLAAPPATTPPEPDHPTGPPAGTPGGRP